VRSLARGLQAPLDFRSKKLLPEVVVPWKMKEKGINSKLQIQSPYKEYGRMIKNYNIQFKNFFHKEKK
jgi:hypothetical protein